MGTKTKTNSNKMNINNKLLKELLERVDSLEQALFHGILRSESMINVILNSNLVSRDVFNVEISRLFEESQAQAINQNNTKNEINLAEPPQVEN
jgi:hypothetical protein